MLTPTTYSTDHRGFNRAKSTALMLIRTLKCAENGKNMALTRETVCISNAGFEIPTLEKKRTAFDHLNLSKT